MVVRVGEQFSLKLKPKTTIKFEFTEGIFDVDCRVSGELCLDHRSCCNWPSGASVLAADGVRVLGIIHRPGLVFHT